MPNPPRVILAAVSFSDLSRLALVLAACLAQQFGAELHVVYVEEPLLNAAADYVGFDLLRDTYEQLQGLIACAWPTAPWLAQPHVIAGPVVDVILDVAHRTSADLIVVGRCSMSAAERLVFESVTDRLRQRSEVSVFVAPAAWLPPSDAQDSIEAARGSDT